MVNFAEIRKHILAGEDDEEGEGYQAAENSAGWRKELDSFTTSAPLSLGAGLLGAAVYDGVANREGTPIFEGTWKTLILISGAMLFGFGAGRMNRGTTAQSEAENYEAIIAKAEEEVQDAEDEKKAAEEKKQEAKSAESHLLYNHESFNLSPSSNGLLGIGEYGAAVGQQGISYRYMG